MSDLIIPKPGTLYSEYLCQGSDGNYYVRNNGQWVKVEGGSENITPIDPRALTGFPVAKKGDKFYIVANGSIQNIALEAGDFLVCIRDTNGSEPDAFVVLQKNIDVQNAVFENLEVLKKLKSSTPHVAIQIIDELGENVPIQTGARIVIIRGIAAANPSLIMYPLKDLPVRTHALELTIINNTNVDFYAYAYSDLGYIDKINNNSSIIIGSGTYNHLFGIRENDLYGIWYYFM